MASILLSSFLKATTDWLSLIRSKPSTSSTSTRTVADDLEKLERMLQRINVVLVDAEERQIADQSVKLWLKEIKDVAYDAEDLLHEYQYNVLRSQVDNRAIAAATATEAPMKMKGVEVEEEVMPSASSDSILATIKISIVNSMANRIKNIRKRFKEISKDRALLHLKLEDGQRRSDGSSEYPQPTSHMVNEQDVYGREDDKKKLIDWLFSNKESRFEVLAVVGKGGLGKTTLAQLVYNDQKVMDYFETRIWICASNDFNLIRLTRAIIESITKQSCTLSDELSHLQETLFKDLQGKKALLVLDDVWNENKGSWECLSIPLHGAAMVRIIVTARNEQVAEIMQTTNQYSLGYLPKKQCWQLFLCHAFCGRDQEQFPLLVAIGKEIVRKCYGLPLAVKALGRLLQHEIDEDKWNDVLHSKLWDNETDILPALILSYHRMPSHLKPCFEICSMFPKDYEFRKVELVKLWAAHGYIQHNNGEKVGVTKKGYRYFNELHRRSFFDKFRENIYKMHDNIHDLAHYVHAGMDLRKHKIHHLLIDNEPLEFYQDNIGDLRTLIIMRRNNIAVSNMFRRNITKLTHLRYLDMKLYWSREELFLPDGLGNLIYLRHLELNIAVNLKVPKSIGDLYNLVVLNITCNGLVELPETLRNLVSLTTIHFYGFENEQLPALGQLPSLISLTVERFDNVKRIGNEFYGGQNDRNRVAFPSLTFLVFWRMSKWKKWDELQEGDFPQLQNLELNCCRRLSSLPSLGNLSSLSHMSIKDCGSRHVLPVGSLPPNLKILENSRHLKLSLPQGFGDLEKLERISGLFGVTIDDLFGILKNLVSLTYLILWNADSAWNVNGHQYNGVGWLHLQKEVLHLVVGRSHNKGIHHSDSKDASFSLLKNLLPQTLINLVSLTTIYLCGFHIDHLPTLGQLPSLKSLTLIKFDNVNSIGTEFYRGQSNHHLVAFPSLASLVLEELTNWEKWDELQEGDFPRLQKLEIYCCRRLSWLPSLGNLSLLWHMSIKDCNSLQLSPVSSFPPNLKTLESTPHSKLSLPQRFGELLKLERLSGRFGVRIDDIFGILNNLLNLKCLILSKLSNAHDAWNSEASLREYSGIEKLVLNWSLLGETKDLHLVVERYQNNGSHHSDSDDENEEDNDNFISYDDGTDQASNASFFVLEKLQPHTNLEELHIIRYDGVGYPSWIGRPSFDRLHEVRLHRCMIEQLPTLGQLPSLRYLHLHSIYYLKRIGDEFCQSIDNNHDGIAFPSLMELVFEHMYHWEEWDGVREGDFPKIETLSLHDCPRLSSLPALQNLSANFDLSIYNCPVLR